MVRLACWRRKGRREKEGKGQARPGPERGRGFHRREREGLTRPGPQWGRGFHQRGIVRGKENASFPWEMGFE